MNQAQTSQSLFIRTLGYLAVALTMTWPLAIHLGDHAIGFPNVDAMDTMMLRGLVADLLTHLSDAPNSTLVYFPIGFPILHLTPNVLDHITGALTTWVFPFPFADNLWWLTVLTLNGLCAHRLGQRLGGNQAAGWLAGLAFMTAEPLVREANLHHAPQSMIFWAPLYLDAVLVWRQNPSHRHAAWAALWLSLAALSYWYLGLFLALGTLPLLWRLPRKQLLTWTGMGVLLCGPWLAPLLFGWNRLPLTSGGPGPVPEGLHPSLDALAVPDRFVALHGTDWLFWWSNAPMDISNQVSLTLVFAAVLGGLVLPKRIRRALWWCVGLGAVMVLGPAAKWGDQLILVGGEAISLPFQWLRWAHPFLERLTWPERWGVLIPLGLIALAARVPKPHLFAGLIVLEGFIRSTNLPLQTTRLDTQSCWSALRPLDGAILELPLKRGGLRASRVGLHQRFHGKAIINPILLPPGAAAPDAWHAWLQAEPVIHAIQQMEDGAWPAVPTDEERKALLQAGVVAFALDVEPGGILTTGAMNRSAAWFNQAFGKPVDLGCAMTWTIDPETAAQIDPTTVLGTEEGKAWRKRMTRELDADPVPDLPTLIRPVWNFLRQK